MPRYLLDTNIVIFMISGELDNISPDVTTILSDYDNELNTNSIVILELLQLYRNKKVSTKKYHTAEDFLKAVEDVFYIKILPFSREHLATLSKLQIAARHKDPFDHAIIAHAITEKLTLISSDRQFENYTGQHLDFIYNKR
jgi:PIN domain nuclease of toxin-antitoxin system